MTNPRNIIRDLRKARAEWNAINFPHLAVASVVLIFDVLTELVTEVWRLREELEEMRSKRNQ